MFYDEYLPTTYRLARGAAIQQQQHRADGICARMTDVVSCDVRLYEYDRRIKNATDHSRMSFEHSSLGIHQQLYIHDIYLYETILYVHI